MIYFTLFTFMNFAAKAEMFFDMGKKASNILMLILADF
jgi:hypothetical protein